jgi:hypothetical protein
MQKIILATETNLSIGNSIRIEFKQIGFPKSDEEIWFNREKELQYNISSPIDWLREKHPDMSNDELQEILDKNGAVKTSVKDKPQPQTMTESILQKINGV